MSEPSERNSALGWVADIEAATLANGDFRRVLFTGNHTQLTVMSLHPGENIGWEMHDHLDQFLRLEQGTGALKLGPAKDDVAETHQVAADWAFIVPAGTWHDVVNDGDEDLRLYSLYSPSEHPDGTVHATKADADAADAAEDNHSR